MLLKLNNKIDKREYFFKNFTCVAFWEAIRNLFLIYSFVITLIKFKIVFFIIIINNFNYIRLNISKHFRFVFSNNTYINICTRS